jgi:iron complex outermembrane receptor protein
MKDRYSYKMGTAIPNPNLKSENALNVDLGMVYKTNKISINPEVFYSKIINTIQFVNNVEPGVAQMQNTGESQFYGTDISIRYQPISHLNTMVNYSFIKRKNLSNPEVLFTDVPEHQANIIIGFTPLKHLEFNINGTYNSDRNSTNYGIKSSKFLVFNAQISYHFKNGIRMETGINNIFDHNYTLTEGYPEAGRNLYFNLYYTFTAK